MHEDPHVPRKTNTHVDVSQDHKCSACSCSDESLLCLLGCNRLHTTSWQCVEIEEKTLVFFAARARSLQLLTGDTKVRGVWQGAYEPGQ